MLFLERFRNFELHVYLLYQCKTDIPQTISFTISIAPQGHSWTQIPQPLQ